MISFGWYHAVEIDHTILLLKFVAEKVLLFLVISLTDDGQQRHNPWTIRKNKIMVMGKIKPGLMASEICPRQDSGANFVAGVVVPVYHDQASADLLPEGCMWLVNNSGQVVSDIPFGAFLGTFKVVVV